MNSRFQHFIRRNVCRVALSKLFHCLMKVASRTVLAFFSIKIRFLQPIKYTYYSFECNFPKNSNLLFLHSIQFQLGPRLRIISRPFIKGFFLRQIYRKQSRGPEATLSYKWQLYISIQTVQIRLSCGVCWTFVTHR